MSATLDNKPPPKPHACEQCEVAQPEQFDPVDGLWLCARCFKS